LQTQLIHIQQNNFRHSNLAQAKQSSPSNRNINSDLCTTVVTPRTNTITAYITHRGEQNVPKQYLKEAEWLDKDYGWGYYTTSNDPNDDNTLIAIDFNFEALQWGVTRQLVKILRDLDDTRRASRVLCVRWRVSGSRIRCFRRGFAANLDRGREEC
jgi:hypothetical protein